MNNYDQSPISLIGCANSAAACACLDETWETLLFTIGHELGRSIGIDIVFDKKSDHDFLNPSISRCVFFESTSRSLISVSYIGFIAITMEGRNTIEAYSLLFPYIDDKNVSCFSGECYLLFTYKAGRSNVLHWCCEGWQHDQYGEYDYYSGNYTSIKPNI